MAKRIVIIGGGPGGYVAAIRAAQLGAEVHLVEQESLGGTCLNVGCIPTKALLHIAETYQTLLNGEKLGIRVDHVGLDWPNVQLYQQSLVSRLVKGVGGLLKANKVKVHRGHANLNDQGAVEVDGRPLEADVIVLAVGSVPFKLTFPGVELDGVIDSTGALSLSAPPKSLVVVGGGVIGVEFASMFNSFGAEVTIVEMLPKILPGLDAEIVDLVHKDLVSKGIRILTGASLQEVQTLNSGLQSKVATSSGSVQLHSEKILVAVGRRPRTDNLGLVEAGISTEQGKIQVNRYFQTSRPQIYAIGDCSSRWMLAHVASAQGVAAVEHALGHSPTYFDHIVPACIYTHPEIASVGFSEEQAREKKETVRVGRFPLSGNGKALIESDGRGLVKIISGGKYGEVLGVHIWGPRATDLIAEAALAMRLEATVDELITTIHAHPTVGEAMPEAALDTESLAIHWPPGLKKGL